MFHVYKEVVIEVGVDIEVGVEVDIEEDFKYANYQVCFFLLNKNTIRL